MEDDTLNPESETRKPAQRSFLLAVIFLLATLILSTLCVIALLLMGPYEGISASQPDSATRILAFTFFRRGWKEHGWQEQSLIFANLGQQ